jgi:hypothetical protein
MTIAFALLLVVHGLIHLMGFAKAFGYAALPALTIPISRPMGAVWLLSALIFLAAAAALLLWPRWWWAVALVGVVSSTAVIIPSWADARFGAAANALVLAALVVGFFWSGPVSLRAEYEDDVLQGLGHAGNDALVLESDLSHLPGPVARYLRQSGVVGKPRVWHFEATMRGRIRSAPDTPWMPLRAEQHNFFVEGRSRYFYMTARRAGVPLAGYHRYAGTEATMRVKVIGLVPVVATSGPEMTRAESVTLFNDMCVFAPATLIDRSIVWEPVNDRTVRARFTNAGHTISADLHFDAAGHLIDFRSADRTQSTDPALIRNAVWSTPVGGKSGGEARWESPTVSFAYIELEDIAISYN